MLTSVTLRELSGCSSSVLSGSYKGESAVVTTSSNGNLTETGSILHIGDADDRWTAKGLMQGNGGGLAEKEVKPAN